MDIKRIFYVCDEDGEKYISNTVAMTLVAFIIGFYSELPLVMGKGIVEVISNALLFGLIFAVPTCIIGLAYRKIGMNDAKRKLGFKLLVYTADDAGKPRISKAKVISIIVFIIAYIASFIILKSIDEPINVLLLTSFFVGLICAVPVFIIGVILSKVYKAIKGRSGSEDSEDESEEKSEEDTETGEDDDSEEKGDDFEDVSDEEEESDDDSEEEEDDSKGIIPLKEKDIDQSSSPVCAVCGEPLDIDKSWFVPNAIFKDSDEYEEVKDLSPLSELEAEFDSKMMVEKDDSAEGSAVCKDCIKFFK